MTIDDPIRDKKLILIENLLKYQLYYLTKSTSMNILLVQEYYHLIKNK